MEGKSFQGSTDEKEGVDDLCSMKRDVKEIKYILESHLAKMTEKEDGAAIAQDWRIVGCVLNRIFFIIYLCITIISLVIVLPWEKIKLFYIKTDDKTQLPFLLESLEH